MYPDHVYLISSYYNYCSNSVYSLPFRLSEHQKRFTAIDFRLMFEFLNSLFFSYVFTTSIRQDVFRAALLLFAPLMVNVDVSITSRCHL